MKQVPQHIFMPGGVNLNKDARAIRPEQLALSKNAWPVIPGILGKRNGVKGLGIAIDGIFDKYFPLSLATIPIVTGYKYVAHFHKYSAPSSHQLMVSDFSNGTTVVQDLGDPQSDYEPVKFINYRGWVYALVPGVEGFYIFGPKYLKGIPTQEYVWTKASFLFDPAVTAIQNSQTIAIRPRCATPYRQRMTWANFGPGMGNWLLMADRATTTVLVAPTTYPLAAIVGPDALSYNGRHIEVAMLEGEDIVAMQEVSLSGMGSQIDNVLMLLSDRTCVFISGEILQTNETGATDPNGLFGTYKENRINFECGCVSQATLAKSPYGWIWASGDDVWLLAGNEPVRVGTNIRPALLACPAGSRKYWSAAYANGIYMLQLVTQQDAIASGDTEGDMTAYLHEYWLLDLRDGPPRFAEEARWYGPMQLVQDNIPGSKPTHFFSPLLADRDTDGTQRILALAGLSSIGALSTGRKTYMVDMLPANGNGQDVITAGISSGIVWSNANTVNVGDVTRPSQDVGRNGSGGMIFVCIQSGTTGANEPNWPIDGVTVVNDGTAQWQELTGEFANSNVEPQQRIDVGYTADIRTRDSALDDGHFDKLLRRVDVNLSANAKVLIQTVAIKNQSDVTALGSTVVGAAAPEGSIVELPSTIAGLKSVARTFRPNENELCQARQMQVSLTDSNSYIIDNTNNYFNIQWFFDVGGSGIGPYSAFTGSTGYLILQIEIPKGSYDNINAILQVIVSKLNTYVGQLQTTWNGEGTYVWSYVDAYAHYRPYCNRLSLAFDDVGFLSTCSLLGPIFSNTDATGLVPSSILGDSAGGTVYLSRTKRLAAMLGFDTNNRNTPDGNPVEPSFSGAADITCVLGSPNPATGRPPLNIDACQIVPYTNSQRFDVASGAMLIQPKAAIPFGDVDRS